MQPPDFESLPPPDRELQRFEDINDYVRSGRIPWRRMHACPDEELRAYDPNEGPPPPFPLRRTAYVLRKVFSRLLQDRFADEIADASAHSLARTSPKASAFRLLTPSQKVLFVALILTAATFFAMAPLTALVAINSLLTAYFLAAISFRLYLTCIGFAAEPRPAPPPVSDAETPVITVLLPVYNEAQSLALLAQAMEALDYPREKLDFKLLVEGDDEMTIKEVERLGLDRIFEIVIVPPSEPRTKPKACNYGLYLARGDLIVIYDVEDTPEKDQLRKAAAAFAAGDNRLACVQAKLNFYGAHESWLTRLFAIEYALWFDTLLPALEKLRIPMPLGGTSNFFRTPLLLKIGGWDPYNVTEDADLGLRLARRGYRTEILDSTTLEEPNPRLGNWIRQRSRWMKGYMQTWLVHMREPVAFFRATGWRGFLATQLFLAGNFFSALTNPFLWITFIWWLVAGPESISRFFPGPLLDLNLFALLFGNCLFIYLGVIAPLKRGWIDLSPHALLAPLYWWITSFAAYKALWQLLTRPSFWEKTSHALSRAAREKRETVGGALR